MAQNDPTETSWEFDAPSHVADLKEMDGADTADHWFRESPLLTYSTCVLFKAATGSVSPLHLSGNKAALWGCGSVVEGERTEKGCFSVCSACVVCFTPCLVQL